MSGSLSGQVVVVTGGAGRIGQAFCRAIAREGGTAVIADINAEAARRLAGDLCGEHHASAAVAMTFDITKADQIDATIERLHARYGRIDAVVNNAYPRNSRYGAKVEAVTYHDFAENLSLHVGGYFTTAQRFGAYFCRQRRGNIIFMGSIYGVIAPRFQIYDNTTMTMPVEYAVIKAGLLHLTRYLAQYYKPFGIRVNSLSPGGIFADQPEDFVKKYSAHAAGGAMLRSEDLTGALVFMLADAASHMTGQNIVIDDGWTL